MIGFTPLMNLNLITQKPPYACVSLNVRAQHPKVNLAHLAVNPQLIAHSVSLHSV